MAWDRRRDHELVTYGELRAILEPIFERQRRAEPAYKLWVELIPLGVEELLPQILRDARVRQVLAGVAEGRWKRWGQVSLVAGILYVSLTVIGSALAILRTAGWIH